jgi:acyl dehydratase
MTEAGELVTAKASADKYQEISRRKLLEGINWTHPVYANDRIYIRTEDGRLLCLERS